MIYQATEAERASEALTPDTLSAIAEDVAHKGYAVVGGLIPPDVCESLLAAVLEDAELVRTRGRPTPHEIATGEGHLQLGLRRAAPYVEADLVANPLIEHVVAAVLGEKAWLGFYSGNVNLPGSVHQPVHYDRPFSWRTREKAAADGQPWPPPTTTLSCSIALTEITADNGATEIYPGTHLETAVTEWPLGERVSKHPELLERWGPPARMSIPAGGVCFRDPRMWHRGVPNPSEAVRPMLALTYHAERCRHWRGRLAKNMDPADLARCLENPALRVLDDGALGDGRLVFEENARPALLSRESQHGINRNVRFVPAPARVNHFLDAHLIGGARVVEDGDVAPEA
ncbi:MAG: phytanoyl-CoA dioxygenase family protein [Pseudomonadota bacterium]